MIWANCNALRHGERLTVRLHLVWNFFVIVVGTDWTQNSTVLEHCLEISMCHIINSRKPSAAIRKYRPNLYPPNFYNSSFNIMIFRLLIFLPCQVSAPFRPEHEDTNCRQSNEIKKSQNDEMKVQKCNINVLLSLVKYMQYITLCIRAPSPSPETEVPGYLPGCLGQ